MALGTSPWKVKDRQSCRGDGDLPCGADRPSKKRGGGLVTSPQICGVAALKPGAMDPGTGDIERLLTAGFLPLQPPAQDEAAAPGTTTTGRGVGDLCRDVSRNTAVGECITLRAESCGVIGIAALAGIGDGIRFAVADAWLGRGLFVCRCGDMPGQGDVERDLGKDKDCD
eukprot:gb/GFBE01026843.1/.p2 GENE.gb/GFBE01026843.1/~~gb/GFBE01026843.1/.p2  ORF type:complete len:170 (-),score=26.64 gb/GFBE01026843.1/:72-581(-)